MLLCYLIIREQPASGADGAALLEAAGILDDLIGARDLAPGKTAHATAVALKATALTELAETEPAGYEQACEAQRAAIAAAEPEAPDLAADARLSLAQLLLDRGGPEDEAIAALDKALEFYQADANTDPWLRCHLHLGRVLARRAKSCEQLAAACAHWEAVASIKPPVAEEGFYSYACWELVRLLQDERCPADAERIDRAMSWSEESLKYWPPDDLSGRADQAEKLARGYLTRSGIRKDQADLQRASELLDLAAQWASESGAPAAAVIDLAHDAAGAHAMLRTDRLRNTEIAIERLQQLLDENGDQMSAATRAGVRKTLGTAYQERIAGDPAGNLELSVQHLEAALAAWDRSTSPDEWASVANNLANSYEKRISGDHGENVEQAITLSEAAMRIRTREKDPQTWARTMHGLGNLYLQRPLGDRARNLEDSISRSQAALEVETRQDYPAEWAGAHRNLGNAYLLRVLGDRVGNLQAAVSCFRDAESVTSGLGDLRAHGDSLQGLGGALGELGSQTQDPSAQAAAVAAFQQAAAAFAELGSADRRAAAYFNLAVTLSRLPGDDPAARALEAAQQCLPAWDADRNPQRAPMAYNMLAGLTDQLGRTGEAYGWIRKALDASEALYAGATAEDSQVQVVADSAQWFLFAVDLALRTGAPASEALLLTERGRTRMLRETAVRLEPDWSIPEDLLAQEARLMGLRRQAWQWIGAADPASEQAAQVLPQVQAITAELAGLWEQMRGHPGGADYVAARHGAISWDRIRDWVDSQPPGFALLEYVVLADRVVAFVVRQHQPEPAVVDIPVGRQALRQCQLALYREMDGSAAGAVRRETWDRAARPLVTLVQPELAGTRLLCLVPHVLLHYFPLHALGESGATLLDQMAVYYAPSAGLAAQLSQGARRAGPAASHRAIVVGDTLGDLGYARQEAVRVGQLLGVQPLTGEQATLAAVLPQLRQADLAHFACHGYLRLDDPGQSAVVLADGMLTAAQLQNSEQLRCDVLVLSGCDTGFQPVQRTLEVGGLPSALIAAGARTAVGALWPVDDEATKELFCAFYEKMSSAAETGGDEITRSVPGCLRAAELALRETRPERYFWAPFIAVGSW